MKLTDNLLFARAHLIRELRSRWKKRHSLRRNGAVWDPRAAEAMKLAGLAQAIRVLNQKMYGTSRAA